MKNKKPTILFTTALLIFTVYVSLDTFVISSAYQTGTTANTAMFDDVQAKENTKDSDSDETTETEDETTDSSESGHHHSHDGSFSKKGKGGRGGNNASGSSKSASVNTTELEVSDEVTDIGEYTDENVTIEVKEYTVNETKVYVADVTADSTEYIKTAFAEDTYGKNVTDTTSNIAKDNDAVLAINGDYYGARESGYVIRNGVVYRDEAGDEDVLCIYADGSMKVVDPSTVSADELVESGVWQAFSFGPGLIEDGEISVTEDQEVGKAMASNPRTAMGVTEDGHYLFVVADGRTEESEGLSLYELADFMKSLGATCAYNLDGGGSSTMYFNGEVINTPTSTGNSSKERSVSDIVYIN